MRKSADSIPLLPGVTLTPRCPPGPKVDSISLPPGWRGGGCSKVSLSQGQLQMGQSVVAGPWLLVLRFSWAYLPRSIDGHVWIMEWRKERFPSGEADDKLSTGAEKIKDIPSKWYKKVNSISPRNLEGFGTLWQSYPNETGVCPHAYIKVKSKLSNPDFVFTPPAVSFSRFS